MVQAICIDENIRVATPPPSQAMMRRHKRELIIMRVTCNPTLIHSIKQKD